MHSTFKSTWFILSFYIILCLGTLLQACSSPTQDQKRTGPSGSRSLSPDAPGSPPDQGYQTFDEVWTLVNERHFDPEHNGVDWVAIREEYRPRIENTRNENDIRMVLGEMLSELGQSHFVIIPANSTDDDEEDDTLESGSGALGMRLDWIDEEAVVVNVEPNSPASSAGVQPGWVIEEVANGEKTIVPSERFSGPLQAMSESPSPMARSQAYMILNRVNAGEIGETRSFTFRDFDDSSTTLELEYAAEDGVRTKFGNLPTMTTKSKSHWISEEELELMGITFDENSPPKIGYLAFNAWMFPIMQPIADGVDTFREADGIVLDLRGNPGGIGGLSMGVAGHFVNDELSLGEMKSRDMVMNFTVNPQRATMDGRLVEPYAGPLAIIVDPGSASTSEIFGAALQQLDRATVFGRNSMGAALPAHTQKLPNGDVFMFAVADFIGPAGKTIEGTGVVPNTHVELTRTRLQEEWDPDLKSAVDWIVHTPSD